MTDAEATRPKGYAMAIYATKRPYTLTFQATGTSYPLTSEDAQRLIDEYPATKTSANRVDLRADDGTTCTLRPATLSGGPAFLIDGFSA